MLIFHTLEVGRVAGVGEASLLVLAVFFFFPSFGLIFLLLVVSVLVKVNVFVCVCVVHFHSDHVDGSW